MKLRVFDTIATPPKKKLSERVEIMIGARKGGRVGARPGGGGAWENE